MLIADSLGTNFDREIKQEDLASLLTYFILKCTILLHIYSKGQLIKQYFNLFSLYS